MSDNQSRDAQKRKAIANEVIYRELNQELELLAGSAVLLICCECGEINCSVPFEVDRVIFDHVRMNPLRFILVPGHEDPELEDIIEKHTHFNIVSKRPTAAVEIAEASDRRLDPDAKP